MNLEQLEEQSPYWRLIADLQLAPLETPVVNSDRFLKQLRSFRSGQLDRITRLVNFDQSNIPGSHSDSFYDLNSPRHISRAFVSRIAQDARACGYDQVDARLQHEFMLKHGGDWHIYNVLRLLAITLNLDSATRSEHATQWASVAAGVLDDPNAIGPLLGPMLLSSRGLLNDKDPQGGNELAATLRSQLPEVSERSTSPPPVKTIEAWLTQVIRQGGHRLLELQGDGKRVH